MTKETSSPGAPPHEPTKVTRELVQLHTMIGTRQEVIASIIGIDPHAPITRGADHDPHI